MKRPSATVVIPAWDEWALTRSCLDVLRPTLRVSDEVVVVDNGSTDGTAGGLLRRSWVHTLTNPDNRGFAAGCNQGAGAATGDVVVFLNNDTLPVGRWLDALLEPFADPTVVATGPRSNMVSGPQLVADAAYDVQRLPSLRSFVRDWERKHRGRVTELARLVGFCLAVRREAFEAVGGFDEGFGVGGYEDDDLCARLAAAGGRLLVAHGSFVHHHGHRTFDAHDLDWHAIQETNRERHEARSGTGRPQALVSACLIVRDEAAQLPICLASLGDLVDEVVVYDTGSVDDSVAVARAAGALVVEGRWDDDFARARNAALAMCTGHWILHVDADEVVDADALAVRRALAETRGDGFTVPIDNLDPSGRSIVSTHDAVRLFRRGRARWQGRLHEQVVPNEGSPPLTLESLAGVRLRHSGYTDEAVIRSAKRERDVRLAEHAALAPGRTGLDLVQAGRALAAAGRHADARDRFAEAARDADDPAVMRMALRGGAQVLLDLDRPRQALEWVRRLQHVGSRTSLTRFLEGVARARVGDPEAALACLEPLGDLVDDDGVTHATAPLHLERGLALAACGRWSEAVADLVEAVDSGATHPELWPALAEACWQAGVRCVATVTTDELTEVAAALLRAPVPAAAAVAEALWAAHEGDSRLLALAVSLGHRLPLDAALEWSARVRAAGLDECPLLAMARAVEVSPEQRVMAAAMSAVTFGDERGREAVAANAAEVEDGLFAPLLTELAVIAPSTLDAFVVGAATSPGRCRALARILRDHGAEHEALAVLRHGLGSGATWADLDRERSRTTVGELS